MSTRAKGDKFERRVLSFVQEWVRSGQSFLNSQRSHFFTKKGYHSPDRGGDIETDISVESYSADATEPSLLLIIECKDYASPVPVDDLEEFKAKLDQITGKNVKGAVFSTNSFQKGAFKYAEANGIALVRVLPDEQVEWILRRTPRPIPLPSRHEHRDEQIRQALTDPEYIGDSEFLFAMVNRKLVSDGDEVLNALAQELEASHENLTRDPVPGEVSVEPGDAPIVPFMGQEYIEARAERMAMFFDPMPSCTSAIDLPALCDYLSGEHGVSFDFDEDLGVDSKGVEILGKISTSPLGIQVSKRLGENTPRWRFTVAHELGHLALHRHLDIASLVGPHFETHESVGRGSLRYEPTPIGRLEWQANAFASCLLMRREHVFRAVLAHLRKHEVRSYAHGVVFVDDQPCNLHPYLDLLSTMSQAFRVSKEAVSLRLARLNILNDQRRGNYISDLLRGRPILG